MPTVDNLLNMERCASCERELAASWKFCLYCGRPFVAASSEPGARRRRKYDGAFWVGVGMGALGIVLIIFAAVQIYGSHA